MILTNFRKLILITKSNVPNKINKTFLKEFVLKFYFEKIKNQYL